MNILTLKIGITNLSNLLIRQCIVLLSNGYILNFITFS